MLQNDMVMLRPISHSDTSNILKWRNSENVKKYFCMQEDLTQEQHEWWLENKVKTGEVIQYIIHLKEENKDIGTVYIRDIDRTNKHGEFGIYIGDSDCRNKGVGTISMNLICEYAFSSLGLHKIYLRVLKTNERAINVYLKNGFVQEGIFRDHLYHQGEYKDLIFMAKIK